MRLLTPLKNSKKARSIEKLCDGQALLCRSLNLKMKDWNKKQFNKKRFYICCCGYKPKKLLELKDAVFLKVEMSTYCIDLLLNLILRSIRYIVQLMLHYK